MPYVILRQDNLPQCFQVRVSESVDFVGLRKGTPIDDFPNQLTLELEADDLEQSDIIEAPYFIVSSKMRKALEDFGIDNLQYFMVSLQEPESLKTYDEYWIVNVVGVVKCVDEGASSFKKLSGSRTILRNFVVDENETHGLPLFRLGESQRLVMITDDLKSHLEKVGLTGLYFQDTNEFNGKPASSFW